LTTLAARANRTAVVRAFQLSLRQLGDPAILAVLAKALAATLLIFLVVGVLQWWWVNWLADALPGGVAAMISVVMGLATGWLLFRIVLVAIVGVLADDVVEAVERRHYPAMLAKARPIGFARSATMGMRGGVRALLVNAALLPVYVAALLAGVVLAPIVFMLANAWLLGRDLGDMVAVRHLASAELPRWRRGTRGPRLLLGGITTALFLIPLLGFLAPVIGAAMATHLFHESETP
jgi:uncharacterized protein involved in cysteine biosynthesis